MLWFQPQSFKVKKELYIEITQENSIEFQVQSIYLIYTKLLVHAILILAYYTINIQTDIIVSEPSTMFFVIHDHVTNVWHHTES